MNALFIVSMFFEQLMVDQVLVPVLSSYCNEDIGKFYSCSVMSLLQRGVSLVAYSWTKSSCHWDPFTTARSVAVALNNSMLEEVVPLTKREYGLGISAGMYPQEQMVDGRLATSAWADQSDRLSHLRLKTDLVKNLSQTHSCCCRN